MIQRYSSVKMTKRCVRTAYGSETVEKWVKMGKVGLLLGVSHTRVKAYIRKPILMCTEPQEHTCICKNKATYT